MKWALIIAIIWLITSLWIIVGTVAYTLSQKDKVVFTEKVLYGEKSVVEGVTIERRCKYMDSVFWDSKYIVGETPQTTTKYKYYQLPHDELVRNDIFKDRSQSKLYRLILARI